MTERHPLGPGVHLGCTIQRHIHREIGEIWEKTHREIGEIRETYFPLISLISLISLFVSP